MFNLYNTDILSVIYAVKKLMPRLHMQVWQPGTERKAFI